MSAASDYDMIRPVTITPDRYGGTYSGGVAGISAQSVSGSRRAVWRRRVR